MCDDIEAFTKQMTEHEVTCSAIQSMGWGLLTKVELPRHARP